MKKYLLLLLLALPCFAQNMRFDAVAWGPRGPVPGATVAVCTQPATTTTTPCSPLASLCSSLTDNVCSQPNPITADSLGNYHFYAKTTLGPYTVQIYGPQVAVPYVLSDQYLNGTLVSPTLSNPTITTPTITGGTWSGSPSITAPTISSPIFNSHINCAAGTAIECGTATGCATAGTFPSTCDTVITWGTPFADTGYIPVCTGAGMNGPAMIQGVFAQTTSTITVRTTNLTAAIASFNSIGCVAIHP